MGKLIKGKIIINRMPYDVQVFLKNGESLVLAPRGASTNRFLEADIDASKTNMKNLLFK